ncbi:MAG TPA: S9 family peptidase [Thermoanaerobaculia bacterium]|nr:S9 family peptidase [Thermoanaerobaculia bacterium]
MRARLLASLALLAGSAAIAATPAETRHSFSLADLERLRSVSDPQVSPDGRWVAYTVRTTDAKDDKRYSDIWMTSMDGKETTRLTTRKENESTPRWSPDGRFLAFLSSRDDANEESQLWLLPRAGGEAEKITERSGGIEDYDWSPDGKRLVLVGEDPDPDSTPSADAKDKDKDKDKKASKTKKPIVIDRYQFKEDVTGYLGKKREHLYLLDLATHKIEPLSSGEYDERQPSWSPDGKTIAFVSKRGADPDRTDNWDVFAVEPRAGASPRALTTYEGSDNDPGWGSRLAWSPDSRWIAYVQGGPDKLIYYGLHKLALLPAAGGAPRILTSTLDRNAESPAFTPDGGTILFRLEDDGSVNLASVPAAGGAVKRLVTGRRVVSRLATGGGKTALLISAPDSPAEVYAFDGSVEPRRLSTQNDALMAELRLGAVSETKFKSKDGTEIHGFLVTPPDYEAGRKYPTILRIHGGPVGQHENAFEDEWQWLAANGYVVVAANPRGSSGRGEEFQRAIYADWGHRDTEDVVGAVDDAIAKGIADPNRLGVGGWSYGGILTNYVIASDTRFRGATSGAGSSNFLASYGTDQYIREYEQELGPPWKTPDVWIKLSYPFLHADRIRTPTLFLCGEADFNVPLLNSEQMYQALRSLGIPTQLVIYPGQFHGIRKPTYVRDRYERYVAWYDKYVKAPAQSSAAPAPAASR